MKSAVSLAEKHPFSSSSKNKTKKIIADLLVVRCVWPVWGSAGRSKQRCGVLCCDAKAFYQQEDIPPRPLLTVKADSQRP